MGSGLERLVRRDPLVRAPDDVHLADAASVELIGHVFHDKLGSVHVGARASGRA